LDNGRVDICVARERLGSCDRIYSRIVVRLSTVAPSLAAARRVKAYFAVLAVPPNTIKISY
jgi:hypothetical protein